MGQFFVVQGTDKVQLEELRLKGVRAFQGITGLAATSEVSRCGSVAITFPQLNGRKCEIVTEKQRSSWACVAGTLLTAQQYGDEVLKRLLSGDASLSDCNGIFALAMCEDRELRIITDRLGSLHVFKTKVGSCTLISTSSLVLGAVAKADWDMVGCREFLATGTIFEDRSLFCNVEKLPAATIIRFHDGNEISRKRYWDPRSIDYRKTTSELCVGELAEALKSSLLTIARHLPQPVMDLTGGLDSRALTGSMLSAGLKFDTVVNGSPRDGDVIIAGRIAAERKLNHRQRSWEAQTPQQWFADAKCALSLCDGEMDILLYGLILSIQRQMSTDFEATLNGSNGEICKGYWWELLMPHTGANGSFNARKVAAKRFAYAGDPGLLAHPFDHDLVEHFTGVLERNNVGLERHPNTAQMDNVYLGVRMQRWQGRIASSTSRIWPCLSPFMFRDVMEIALSAPPALRVRNRLTRRLIEHLDPGLSAIPLDDGMPAMPLRLSTAHHFWPLAKHYGDKALRRALKRPAAKISENKLRGLWQLEEVRSLLEPQNMRSLGLYDASKLSGLITASQQESFSSSALFGRVLTLEMVARTMLWN